jgi:hypothetical protein
MIGTLFVVGAGLSIATSAQTAYYPSFWPREFVVGMQNPIIEVNGFNFTRDTVVQINGRTIPTDATRIGKKNTVDLLTAEVPGSVLSQSGSFQVNIYERGVRTSSPTDVRVVPSKQPARIEIQLPKTRLTPKEKVTLTVRVTNLGTESFYVPTKLRLGSTGNMLDSSYHL